MNYLPKNEVELSKWLESFTSSLSELGHEIGIGKAEVTFINTLSKIVRDDILRYQLNINNDVMIKSINKKSLIESISSVVSRVRKHPKYSESFHGVKLGINVKSMKETNQ